MKLKHFLTLTALLYAGMTATADVIPVVIYSNSKAEPRLVEKDTGREVTLTFNGSKNRYEGECETGMCIFSVLNTYNNQTKDQRISCEAYVTPDEGEADCWLTFSDRVIYCTNVYKDPETGAEMPFVRGVDYTDSFTVTDYNGDERAVTVGDYYDNNGAKTGVVFLAHTTYTIHYNATVADTHPDYFPYSADVSCSSGGSLTKLTFAQPRIVTLSAPTDATCSVSQKKGTTHYVPFLYYEPVTHETLDGVTKYTYHIPETATELSYRVSRPGSMTRAEWFKPASTPDITVSEEELSGYTDHFFSHDDKEQKYADIYLNINQRGQLNLKSDGGYHDIVNLRTWQLTGSVTANNFLEPDYTYTVLNTDFQPDNSVVEVNEKGHVTPKSPGTAIVQVRYNALGFEGKAWSELWAENTGTFVVTVDADAAAMPEDNIHLAYKSDKPVDAEHDILYYMADEPGYRLTFTPQSGCTVTVANPLVDREKNTVSYPDAFSDANVTDNGDGSYTVLLTYGRNIIRTTDAAGNAVYQVLSAKPMTCDIVYSRDDKYILPGDHVKLQLSGLYHVAGKLAGIYNSNCHVSYNDEVMDKGLIIGGGQYDFNSRPGSQRFEFDVPLRPESASYPVVRGCLVPEGYGSSPGAHRAITIEGVNPNFNAGISSGSYGSLPERNIPLSTFGEVDMLKVTVDMGGRVMPVSQPVLEEYFGKDAKWVSENPSVARVNESTNGIFPCAGGKTMVYLRRPGSEDNLLACEVTVNPKEGFTPVTGIRYDGDYEDIRIMNTNWGNWGNQQYLTAYVEPENATNRNIIYTSDNPDNVAFSKAGLASVTKPSTGLWWNRSDVAGDAYVTVETEDGGFTLERPIHIMFYHPCTSLSFVSESPEIKTGETYPLEVSIKPENGQCAPAEYSSDNEDVATVDANGVVTGMGEGEANITAKSYQLYKSPITAAIKVKVSDTTTGVGSVACTDADNWSMTPNPAVSHITVTSDRAGTIYIYNLSGHLILSSGIEDGSNTIDVGSLAHGCYLVSLNGVTKRLIKK